MASWDIRPASLSFKAGRVKTRKTRKGGAIATSSWRRKKMDTERISKSYLERLLIVSLALSFLFASGCSNPVAHIPELSTNQLGGIKPLYGPSPDSLYRLAPYDIINIRFTYHAEQDPKGPISIRPDGNITLEGIGEIQAMGLTPDQLAKVITEKSSGRMKDPEVVVTVGQYAPKRVYVGGEVKTPGVILLQDNMLTPLQAIFDRGGFTTAAQVDSVILIRDAGSPNPKIGRINLHEAMEGGLPEQIALLPNDVLYVPMTGIGRADLWVKQHITDLIPQAFLRPPIPSGRDLFFGR
jgi:polysaccharide export outer membrane protein